MDFQVRHAPELVGVACAERLILAQGRGGDPRVVGADERSLASQFAGNLAEAPGGYIAVSEQTERPHERLPLAWAGLHLAAAEGLPAPEAHQNQRALVTCPLREDWGNVSCS